ncbi:cache domain-containing protein [bacterium]|nr:cache domain-containing protein [bacterium]
MIRRLFNNKLSLASILLINTVLITVFALGLIGYLWISRERERFSEEEVNLRRDYISSQKQFLKREVEHAIRVITYTKDQIEARLQASLKSRVYEAYSIADSIWRANRGHKPDGEIVTMIRDALTAIRFNNGRGYYFATRVDGTVMIFADRPGEEGKNYWNTKDINGKYFVREMSRIVSEESEGFITYTMTKPHSRGNAFPKMAFVKHFQPYDWYIGTGEYLDDFEMLFKQDVLKLLQTMEYGGGGYIFAGQWDGVTLSGPALGKNMIDVTDLNGVKIVQELIRVSKEGGGYVSYVMPSLDGKRHAPKISYVEGFADWQWYIGAGTYVDEIDAVIAEKRFQLEQQIRHKISTVIIILVLCLLIISVIAKMLSNRIHKNIRSITDFFEISSTSFIPMDERKLNFPEFSRLAGSANRMIEERNEAGKALQESEEQMRVILDSVKIGIVIIDPDDFQIIRLNPHAAKMINLSEEEIIGKPCNRFICPRSEDQCPIKTVQHFESHADQHLRSATGELIPIIKSFARIQLQGKEHFLESFIDITELKAREKEIQDLRNYLRSIIDSMPSAIIGVDAAGNVTQSNAESESITGISPAEAFGLPWQNLLSSLPIDLNAIEAAIKNGMPLKIQNMKLQGSDGLKHLDVTVYPLISTSDNGAVIRIDDVSERERLNGLLIQTEKMMSVGGLAAGMAHELNNPLGGIIQGIQNIQRRLSPDLASNHDPARELGIDLTNLQAYLERREIHSFIKGIQDSGKKAAEIISNMLQFSRKSESQMAPVNVAELIENTIEMAGKDYDLKKKYDFRNIIIAREFDSGLPPVSCNRTEIEQVLLNLLRNATQAMVEGEQIGPPRITIRLLEDGNQVKIEVEDNGPGIEETVCSRIFEPFFTTKPVGEGTGLGLSVSYMIVTNNHNGTMEVESEMGKGTKFIVRLPLDRDMYA